jgi:EAL domain-containing protein (putative c-di-GMP-specific phosphodiesterase class I)/GGDEF domain-containing protein
MTGYQTQASSEPFLDAIGRTAVFAFQPIVNINTGACFGVEALLRNVDSLGFSSIPDLFDYAWNAGILHRLDMVLRQTAIAQFAQAPACRGKHLFFNIDGRIFESRDYHPHQTIKILNRYGLRPETLVLELPEKYDNASARNLSDTLDVCRQHNYKIAIDDFGRGFSELKMLYDHQPDFIKIDRFFISGLADDSKKRLFVSSIVNLAHVLGTMVVAEGVETEGEFLAAKEIGCDLVQGFYVAKPTVDHDTLLPAYKIVFDTNTRDRRRRESDEFLIRDHMEPLAVLRIEDDMDSVFESFRLHKDQSVFPVVSQDGTPLGLVREGDLKDFIYLQYGRDLLQNKAFRRSLRDFLRRCPLADINADAEKILESYAINAESDGVIVVEDFRYAGFLTTDALLRIINEKNVNIARDQNPLSNLPGNNSINARLARIIEGRDTSATAIYFDFNNFKPFNDTYGFRQGDRAITLFADLMRKETAGTNAFLGHVGGDDFVMLLTGIDPADARALAERIARRFAEGVESLYPPDIREAGFFEARDRQGRPARYGLLTTSFAVLHIPASSRILGADAVLSAITNAKQAAKRAENGFSEAWI